MHARMHAYIRAFAFGVACLLFPSAQNLEASEAVPAYEKMPTTPWSVLNYRP